jgi:hypothetical protein
MAKHILESDGLLIVLEDRLLFRSKASQNLHLLHLRNKLPNIRIQWKPVLFHHLHETDGGEELGQRSAVS